jgi:hypothetical protein
MLDDKLKQLIRTYKDSPNEEQFIAHIEKAFADEGWRSPEDIKKAYELAGQVIKTSPKLSPKGQMTGSEWLNRFLKEMGWENGKVPKVGKVEDILEAAKKASGLK